MTETEDIHGYPRIAYPNPSISVPVVHGYGYGRIRIRMTKNLSTGYPCRTLEFTLCAFLPEASTGDDPGLHVVVSFHSQKISLLLLEMPNAGGC